MRQVIRWLRKTFPNRPLFAIGYSLGANILVNVRKVYSNELTLVASDDFLFIVPG